MPSAPPATVDDLGLTGALYLSALLEAQRKRLRVAPTRRMTVVVLNRLRELGLIDVPWPEPQWPTVHTDIEETPLEAMQWRFLWSAYASDGLPGVLTDYLQSIPYDEYGVALRLRLWQELALAEAERYFEALLTKHQFDPNWAQDLVFVERESKAVLSAAQWRYCCWAAVRQGGSVAQQQRAHDSGVIREAIYAELRRRLGPVASGQWGATFTPFNPTPESALCRVFVRDLTRLGQEFWSLVPSEMALMQPRVTVVMC